MKKAAMFGLDARIALAIFGALSVISGAALYSAIQDAKVTSYITDMDNAGKATAQYLLDTGVYPPILGVTATGAGYLDTLYLIKNGSPAINNWNGPYLSYSDDYSDANGLLLHTSGNKIVMSVMKTSTWEDVRLNTNDGPRCEKGDASCAVFACISDLPANIQTAIDVKVDGGTADSDEGSVRYLANQWTCMNVMPYPSSNSTLL